MAVCVRGWGAGVKRTFHAVCGREPRRGYTSVGQRTEHPSLLCHDSGMTDSVGSPALTPSEALAAWKAANEALLEETIRIARGGLLDAVAMGEFRAAVELARQRCEEAMPRGAGSS